MIRLRNRYFLLADALAVIVAAYLAFAFRFGWLVIGPASLGGVAPEYRYHVDFFTFAGIAVIVKLGVFMAFGVYRQYWRYAGFSELLSLVLANTVGVGVLGAVIVGARFFELVPGFSRAVPPLDWLFCLALTVGLRASVRALGEAQMRASRQPVGEWRRVLIAGAGDAGSLMAREMQRNPQLGLLPVGFLDDDLTKVGKRIHGIEVLGQTSDIADVALAHRVDEVVIAIPTAPGSTIREMVQTCQDLGLPSKVIPGVFELLDGQLTVSRLRGVEIGDLLRRPQVGTSEAAPAYLTGARVIVTGAGGSIGAELCRQIASRGPASLMILGHGENSIFAIAEELRLRYPRLGVAATICDIRDKNRLFRIFDAVKPDAVFHAAAHKHVPLMEENAPEAITNNVLGTRLVVEASAAVCVKHFVLVSTDKAAAPSSVMGASKRIAEAIVQRAARRYRLPFVVVRFGNVLGSRGSVVPTFTAQISRGGPVTVTHPEVRRYFMTIPEAVHLILQAGSLGKGGELFVLEMGDPVLLREMAADMIRLSGLSEKDVPIVFTGLRPGEKLTEVLWEDDATVEATERADIRRVREPAEIDPDRLDPLIDQLLDAAYRDDREGIVRLLAATLPSSMLTLRSPGSASPPSSTSVH